MKPFTFDEPVVNGVTEHKLPYRTVGSTGGIPF
jgi:hypothetical protein